MRLKLFSLNTENRINPGVINQVPYLHSSNVARCSLDSFVEVDLATRLLNSSIGRR